MIRYRRPTIKQKKGEKSNNSFTVNWCSFHTHDIFFYFWSEYLSIYFCRILHSFVFVSSYSFQCFLLFHLIFETHTIEIRVDYFGYFQCWLEWAWIRWSTVCTCVCVYVSVCLVNAAKTTATTMPMNVFEMNRWTMAATTYTANEQMNVL